MTGYDGFIWGKKRGFIRTLFDIPSIPFCKKGTLIEEHSKNLRRNTEQNPSKNQNNGTKKATQSWIALQS
jgi:hypothetical protein